MITISYAITVYNELEEIKTLVSFIKKYKQKEDEIVILFDTKGTKEVENYLDKLKEVKVIKDEFKNQFAKWKNKLTESCSKQFVFQLDADEIPHENLIKNIPAVIHSNPEVEAYFIPRINTVKNITTGDLNKWNWRINDLGWINFPDYQKRLYKKDYPRIRWNGKVHETIIGFTNYAPLPGTEEWSLYHHKTLEKQKKQNNFYETL